VPENAAAADAGSIQTALADLNRTVHEPARLAILTVLSSCITADFNFLKTATGLTSGNLSVQLTRLEEVHLITVEKTIERKRTLTMIALTETGRTELNRYWEYMERFRKCVRSDVCLITETGEEAGRKECSARPA
jgi:DNA-binding transcriptional ArsR family regulator